MGTEIRNFADRVAILKAIHRGIDDVNRLNEGKPPIDKAPATKLFGEGTLDSLGIMHLLAAVEGHLERDLGMEIVIVSDMFEIDDHPLETVQKLADHIERVVTKKRASMQVRG
jgi:acyl carrier protein